MDSTPLKKLNECIVDMWNTLVHHNFQNETEVI